MHAHTHIYNNNDMIRKRKNTKHRKKKTEPLSSSPIFRVAYAACRFAVINIKIITLSTRRDDRRQSSKKQSLFYVNVETPGDDTGRSGVHSKLDLLRGGP